MANEKNTLGFQTVKWAEQHSARRWRKIKFYVGSLDELTGGGINSRGIVEIAGEAGSGKTQLSLHLSLSSQFQHHTEGMEKGVVFISTEHPFPSRRLMQMHERFATKYDASNVKTINFTDNIFLENVNSSTLLEQCILQRLPVLLKNNPIGLIVIDSITAAYAAEQNYVDRAHSFRKVVHALYLLQEQFDLAVVCTNQVRSLIDSSTLGDEKIIPALGLAWSSLVHTRLQLSRTQGTNARVCRLLFSPTAAASECHFVITEQGISDS
ncbi:DNA repair protein XRCC3 [Toxorhynchites rutilus septentrionalis]|uniref:DNA repair protein XRCC3 n=1 Tax=Toxorhynchites rutilus septentrionalis TaxID=329112 RepID=UPI0024794B2C|nr:DNA repair protein XRCC3 [Toxorhynchites rutilus septentrionalis]